MILIAEIFFVIANIGMAWYHAFLIKDERKIQHGWWAAAYLLFAGVVSYFNHSWVLFLLSLLIRKVFFDLFLNLFRGNVGLFYVSNEVVRINLKQAIRKGKLIDWIHYKIFGKKSEIYMGLYILLIIAINLFL